MGAQQHRHHPYARLGGRLIGEIENGLRRAIHTDALGSVRQKTDQFGTVWLDDVRAPYGSTLLGGSYRNGPAFTGHMLAGEWIAMMEGVAISVRYSPITRALFVRARSK